MNVLIKGKNAGHAGSSDQPASAVGRGAAHLMADTTRHGHVVYVGCGRYCEIEEAVMRPAYESIMGEGRADDDDAL